MSCTIETMLCPNSKYNIKCPCSMSPNYVVIHNTYNDASARNEVSYMIKNNAEVSFHYAVDDVRAVQGIPLNRTAWHAGDGRKANGGNMKGIAIEICYSKSGGERFTKAEKNAAWLAAKLLYTYGWDISHLKKHQDFSSKYCPHRTLDLGWQRFVKMVQAELDALKGVNKKLVTNQTTTSSVKYLNLDPSEPVRSVYNSSLKKVGEIKPGKYKGLSYKIIGYTNNNRYVRIKTTTFGEVRICVDKSVIGNSFSISNSKKY